MSSRSQPIDFSDADRQRLGLRLIRSVSIHPESTANLRAEFLLPTGTRATCEFSNVHGSQTITSIEVQSPPSSLQATNSRPLAKADLSNFPWREVTDEISTVIADIAQAPGRSELSASFDAVSVETVRKVGYRYPPERKNSNLPRLLRLAIRYADLSQSEPDLFRPKSARLSVHQLMVEDELVSVSTIAMSKKYVAQARQVGFLRPTRQRLRGAELSGLARYLQRLGFADPWDDWSYDSKRWRSAMRDFTENQPDEFWEDLWDARVALQPHLAEGQSLHDVLRWLDSPEGQAELQNKQQA